MKKLLLCFMVLFMSCSASAAWESNAQDNIFGERDALLIGQLNVSNAVSLFRCSGDDLSFSYVEFIKDADVKDRPADLLFKVDGNSVIKFDATFGVKNNKAVEAISYDEGQIVKALKELKSANGKYLIGVNIKGATPEDDYKISHPGNIARSTAEVNKFVKACDIKL
ncbi:hypothetical protein H9I31_006435 [Morganella morganii]|uniref:hypothetical protein n=1 Tax=Morganella morganii TaxID=582 RepID=UPI000662BAF3|nr:hypothetical protein [Morganella morganii]MBV7311523.1 hypothetical protein [Morganella morganii]HBV9098652.1 hypothetical protein [Morganella morganii]HEI8681863.1 hypothetical protein [Morganella morganii]